MQSRYDGTYSGGPFILIAGVKNPRKNTAVVGSDDQCIRFWNRVEKEGPEIDVEINTSEDTTKIKTIYVDSGAHPSVLFERFQQYTKKKVNDRVAELITEVLRKYPNLEKQAREDILTLHKLFALSAAIYYDRYIQRDTIVIKRELLTRFLEHDTLPAIKNLSNKEVEEISEFVRSEGENPPLIYTN